MNPKSQNQSEQDENYNQGRDPRRAVDPEARKGSNPLKAARDDASFEGEEKDPKISADEEDSETRNFTSDLSEDEDASEKTILNQAQNADAGKNAQDPIVGRRSA